MERYCLHCNERLLGRSDKKFCDDHCRNQFNNIRSRIQNPNISYINLQLKRNRSILEILFNIHKEVEIPRRILSENGFDFRFFTHEETSSYLTKYCYEYGFEQVNELKINLVKWEPEK